MRKSSALTFAVLSTVVLTAACAEVPTAEIEAARSAVSQARSVGAGEYAPDPLDRAENELQALEAELETQQQKFALTRSYDRATELARNAAAAGAKATSEGQAGKLAAQQEATTLATGLRTALDEVKALLGNAPKGKGSAADIEAMAADVASIESTLAEIDAAIASGRFNEARNKARASQELSATIKADIETAMAAKSGRRRG